MILLELFLYLIFYLIHFQIIFLFFASLVDFSGNVEYRHPLIGQGNQETGNQQSNTGGNSRVRHLPMGGCMGGACGM